MYNILIFQFQLLVSVILAALITGGVIGLYAFIRWSVKAIEGMLDD